MTSFTDMELDALTELANIGSGTAATALASLVGKEIDLTVPTARALELAEAVDAAGPPDELVTGVVLPVHGDLQAIVLLVFSESDAQLLCSLLGLEHGTEIGLSALSEIANILGSSYIGAIGTMTGLAIEPAPPELARDELAAVVSTVLAVGAQTSDVALMLDSQLVIAGDDCTFSFMFVPAPGGAAELLRRLGIA